jgi:threonine dehydrogenase-like Zn-dependent dehydrogenase
MRAVCWYGKRDVRVEEVAEPRILNSHDAIVRVTSTAICGSDLHLYNGMNPSMRRGDILGHEFMGEVVELGRDVRNLSPGDRVVVPFAIACGRCFYCSRDLWSLCDNTNPNAALAEALFGFSTAGLFGYSQLTGGYAGGQAEYVRVPFAGVGPLKVPEALSDEQVLFLSDILPTGFMAAENCEIQKGDTIAVWGCGPVGQLSIRSALLLGAERVIAIDRIPERLRLAERASEEFHGVPVEVIDCERERDVVEILKQQTAGRGPDACIDAVGMEAHGTGLLAVYDRVKQGMRLETDNPWVLRQALQACRKGGIVSVPGVYTGFADKFPVGAFMEKGITMRTGQTHVHRYLKPLLEAITNERIDPSVVISHRLSLDDAPHAYEIFESKRDQCIKVVMQP